jgi:hypothetical protein
MSDLWHAITCKWYRLWRRHRYHQPFWRHDKTAQFLGVAQYGCWRCGRGAIEERDAGTAALAGDGGPAVAEPTDERKP